MRKVSRTPTIGVQELEGFVTATPCPPGFEEDAWNGLVEDFRERLQQAAAMGTSPIDIGSGPFTLRSFCPRLGAALCQDEEDVAFWKSAPVKSARDAIGTLLSFETRLKAHSDFKIFAKYIQRCDGVLNIGQIRSLSHSLWQLLSNHLSVRYEQKTPQLVEFSKRVLEVAILRLTGKSVTVYRLELQGDAPTVGQEQEPPSTQRSDAGALSDAGNSSGPASAPDSDLDPAPTPAPVPDVVQEELILPDMASLAEQLSLLGNLGEDSLGLLPGVLEKMRLERVAAIAQTQEKLDDITARNKLTIKGNRERALAGKKTLREMYDFGQLANAPGMSRARRYDPKQNPVYIETQKVVDSLGSEILALGEELDTAETTLKARIGTLHKEIKEINAVAAEAKATAVSLKSMGKKFATLTSPRI